MLERGDERSRKERDGTEVNKERTHEWGATIVKRVLWVSKIRYKLSEMI